MTNLVSTTSVITPVIQQESTSVENVYIAKSHWISFVKPITYMILASIGLLIAYYIASWIRYIIGIYSFFAFINAFNSFIHYKTFRMILRREQISLSAGWLTSNQLDIPIRKREGVLITQSILGKIFNYGQVTIST
ncbi:MAG: PH domain-containing protein, partial [Bergeyella zoohelcum]|nr:PH domain-containing protein [Bergeyella zoohelcum]